MSSDDLRISNESYGRKSPVKSSDITLTGQSTKIGKEVPKVPYLLILMYSFGIYGLPSLATVYASYMNIFYTSHYGIGAYIITVSLTTINIVGLYTSLYAGLMVENFNAKDQLMKERKSAIGNSTIKRGFHHTIVEVLKNIGFIGWSTIVSIFIMCVFITLFIIPFSVFSFSMLEIWFVITQLFLYVGYFCWQLFSMAYVYAFTSDELVLAVFFTFNNVMQNVGSVFGNWECPYVYSVSFSLFQNTGFAVCTLSTLFSMVLLTCFSSWSIVPCNHTHIYNHSTVYLHTYSTRVTQRRTTT